MNYLPELTFRPDVLSRTQIMIPIFGVLDNADHELFFKYFLFDVFNIKVAICDAIEKDIGDQ